MKRLIATIIAVPLSAGCASYHAVVKTGVEPGPRKVEDQWADSWVGGLVPPDAVDAEPGCGEEGVAVVETRISFMNSLVSALTFGIYTPMEIVVTCGSAEDTGETQPDDDDASRPPPSTKNGADRPGGG